MGILNFRGFGFLEFAICWVVGFWDFRVCGSLGDFDFWGSVDFGILGFGLLCFLQLVEFGSSRFLADTFTYMEAATSTPREGVGV